MPSSRRQASPAEQLSLLREALVQGAPPEELARLAHGLDPGLVATLRWSLATGRQARPQPDPGFVRDLRRDLVAAASGSVVQPLQPPVSPVALDGPWPAPPRPLREEPLPAPQAHPRWTWLHLAAAAVLALMLAGSVLLVRQATFEQPEMQLGAPGAPTTETLFDSTLTTATESWTPLAVEQWRFLPDATLTIPPVDGPQWIVADTGPIVVRVAGEGQVLAPGASVTVPAGQALELRNPGLAEAALYRGVATTGFVLEEYDRALVTTGVVLDTEAHESLPPGASRVVFDRLSIPAGTRMRAETATGQDWFDVITGQLGLTLIGDALPPGWSSGRERELGPDDPIPVLVPGTHIIMHSVGDDSLVLLRLQVLPQDPAQDPGSG